MLAEAPRYRYTGQGVEWPQGCLQRALYRIVTQAISRALFIWPSYCVCQYDLGRRQTSVGSATCVQLLTCFWCTPFRGFIWGRKEGRKPSRLFSIARDWWRFGLFLRYPFLTPFPVLLLSFPYKYRLWPLCSAGAGNQLFFSLSLKYHAILSFFPWPSTNSFFIYVVYGYVVDTGRPHSGEWNKECALVPMTLYVWSDMNIAKAQHPACSCQISKEKKKPPRNTKINEVT